jgi:hypothetical protein
MKVQILNGIVTAWGEMPNAPVDNLEIFENGVPDDFSLDKYTYTPLAGNVYNQNGFALRAVTPSINLEVFQQRSAEMYEYMFGQLGNTTAYRTFCTDTDALNTTYENAGNLALIAFIRSVNDPIWGNYSTTGFTSKTTYRGTTVGGVYTRQTAILNILSP